MTRDKYRERLIEWLSELGLYRSQYDYVIDNLALTLEMRDRNLKEWKADGYKQTQDYTNKGGATNRTKTPYFDNHLKYSDMILKYSRTLGLTPADSNRLGISMSGEEEEDDGLIV